MMPSSINGCRPWGVFKVVRGPVVWRGRSLTVDLYIFLRTAPTPSQTVFPDDSAASAPYQAFKTRQEMPTRICAAASFGNTRSAPAALILMLSVSHTHRAWGRVNETKLSIEILRLTIREKADIAGFRHVGIDVFHDLGHDSFS